MTEDIQANPTLQPTKDQAARAADDLRTAATQRARQLRDAAGQQASYLYDQAEAQADQFRQSAEAQWEVAKQRAKDLQVELEHYVRENPTKSVLVVFGAGFLLGMLLRR